MMNTEKARDALKTALRIHESLGDHDGPRQLSERTQTLIQGIRAAVLIALESLED